MKSRLYLVFGMTILFYILFLIVASAVDYTHRTCSDTWGFDCGDTCTTEGDNTFDACPTCAQTDERINEIYLNATTIEYGSSIGVICEYYSSETIADELYVYYRNSSSGTWVQKCSGNGDGTGSTVRNWTVCGFVVDNVEGEQQVRCIIDYDGESDECADAGGFWDNDDANFTVESVADSCTPPAINNDWTITDMCEKDNEVIDLGTGSLIIDASGGGD